LIDLKKGQTIQFNYFAVQAIVREADSGCGAIFRFYVVALMTEDDSHFVSNEANVKVIK
jgi:hypothetical protein